MKIVLGMVYMILILLSHKLILGILMVQALILIIFTKKIKWLRIAGIIVLVLLSVIFYDLYLTTRVGGGSVDILVNYREYYIAKRDTSGVDWGTGTNSQTVIYFFPGQKSALMKRLKKDVEDELKMLVEANPDYFYKYSISEDFRKIRLYRYKGIPSAPWKTPVGANGTINSSTIRNKIYLYFEIKAKDYGSMSDVLGVVEGDMTKPQE